MDDLDTKSLSKYLSSAGGVERQHLPWFVRWISHYLGLEEKTGIDHGGNTKEAFLDSIRLRLQPWQLQQAANAVRLFLDYSHHTRSEPESPGPFASWQQVLTEMKSELRVQNKSYRTEKTYLYWANDFSAWVGSLPPDESSEHDVRRYLTHLSVHRNISFSTQKQAFIACDNSQNNEPALAGLT